MHANWTWIIPSASLRSKFRCGSGFFFFFCPTPTQLGQKKKKKTQTSSGCVQRKLNIDYASPSLRHLSRLCTTPKRWPTFFFPPPASQSAAAPTTWHKRRTNLALIAAQREAESPLGARFSENLIVWTGPEWTNYPHAVFPSQSCVI